MSDGDLGRLVSQMRKFLVFTIAAARRGGSQDAPLRVREPDSLLILIP